MKKIISFFLMFALCTSFIHSETVPHTQQTEQKPSKNRRRRRRRETPVETVTYVSPLEKIDNPALHICNAMPRNSSMQLYVQNVQFTHSGISSFFNNTFNRKGYGKDYLPHSFAHLTQFLHYADESKQPLEFVESVVRLFNQKLKSAQYVNPQALEELLSSATPFLADRFIEQDFFKSIKDLLWKSFKNQFNFLREHPMQFFENVTEDIQKQVTVQYTNPERFRSILLRFLTASIDRVIWCPDDQKETWESFKKIGDLLTELHTQKIIPDEYDINDLYWSLVEQYCYFLELAGSGLELETCKTIKKDLMTMSVKWLETPEQEDGIETKTDRLAQAILEAEAKARAFQQGILTDIIPMN